MNAADDAYAFPDFNWESKPKGKFPDIPVDAPGWMTWGTPIDALENRSSQPDETAQSKESAARNPEEQSLEDEQVPESEEIPKVRLISTRHLIPEEEKWPLDYHDPTEHERRLHPELDQFMKVRPYDATIGLGKQPKVRSYASPVVRRLSRKGEERREVRGCEVCFGKGDGNGVIHHDIWCPDYCCTSCGSKDFEQVDSYRSRCKSCGETYG